MVKVIQQSSRDWLEEKAKKTKAVLGQMETQSKEELAAKLAASLGMSYIDLQIFPPNPADVALVPEADARRHRLVSFEKVGNAVRVALADPEDAAAVAYIDALAAENRWKLEKYVASHQSLDRAWTTYQSAPVLESLDMWRVSLEGEELKKFEEDFGELLQLKQASNIPVSRTIEIIMAGANKLRASDIHIEPGDGAVRLRYRIDGMLQDIGTLSHDVYRLTLSRVKMLAHMKINIRDRAQDGHFGIELDGRKVDLRVNIIPGNHGENINMRILNSESVLLDIATLGIRGDTADKILHEMQKPHGMILNTGPTGSGKTTTLYSLLNIINKSDVKIITIEDPIEYQIPGIVQTEVSKDKSYTFGAALRAVVRQDPDVVLVGEIRDEETADVSVNAAMTGHLLLSTIHANTAPGAIPRLLEMGIRPSLIASSINIVIGQRLVRRLCDHCRESYAPAEETVRNLKRLLSIISPKANVTMPDKVDLLWRAKGCAQCNFSGYHGRVGIYEVFSITKRIEEVILDLGTEKDVAKAALEDGMVTMLQDGILKSIEGITTMDEVWHATGQEEFLEEFYRDITPATLSSSSAVDGTFSGDATEMIGDPAKFSGFLASMPAEKIFETLLTGAVAMKVTDIQLEPTERSVSVRFRRDGILEQVAEIRSESLQPAVSEIKLLAGMESASRPGVQEGRFTSTIGSATGEPREVALRVAIVLGGYGETVMIKIMEEEKDIKLENLGLRDTHLRKILSFCKRSYGLFVASGPDGSGKTTLLYNLLRSLSSPETKIVTVEDPIERRMPGILQTQVDEAREYSFPEAITSLLRQGPNILLASEIRNAETAEALTEAALTGHLTFSSMQGNSASLAATRLSGFGIRGEDFANAGMTIAGVRLVRRLCEHCKEEVVPDKDAEALIGKVLAGISPAAGITIPKQYSIYQGKGCEQCGGSGFSGQTMLSEMLPVTPGVAEILATSPIATAVEAKAKEEGMLTLAEDGVLAVLEGKTTLAEVERVTEE